MLTLLHAGPHGHLHPSDLIALAVLVAFFAALILWQRVVCK